MTASSVSDYRDYAALAAQADERAERAFSAALRESYRRLADSFRALARQRARFGERNYAAPQPLNSSSEG
jgi:hypothetical protein